MSPDEKAFEIDARTCDGLNIFSDKQRFSVFGLLADRAQTTDARHRLRQLLASPVRSRPSILERQEYAAFAIRHHEVLSKVRLNDSIALQCFESTLDGDRPKFTYRLREGLSSDRFGKLILRNEGVCDLLASKPARAG